MGSYKVFTVNKYVYIDYGLRSLFRSSQQFIKVLLWWRSLRL